jgi:hypothetical protein
VGGLEAEHRDERGEVVLLVAARAVRARPLALPVTTPVVPDDREALREEVDDGEPVTSACSWAKSARPARLATPTLA